MLNELVPSDENSASSFAVLHQPIENLRQIFIENLGKAEIGISDLERLRVPPGAAGVWTIETPTGPESTPTIEGILVSWADRRSYWPTALEVSGGHAKPDCSSRDGRTGVGRPGGICRLCPLAQFGSGAKGEAPACKLTRDLFFLRSSSYLPELLRVPPTSIPAARAYLTRLAARGIPYYGVVTRLGLEKSSNPQNIAYSRATFTAGLRLTAEQIARVKEYLTLIGPLLEALPDEASENYGPSSEGEII